MKETLFLKLNNEQAWFSATNSDPEAPAEGFDPLADEPITAAYYGRGYEGETFHGDSDELDAWIKDIRGDTFDLNTVVILSGVNLVAMQVNIPSKQAKHVAQALPFMLEDLVAQDVETLHIAMGARRKSGELPVILSQQLDIGNLVNNLADHGIKLQAVVGDMSCLPEEHGVWRFLTDGSALIVKVSDQDALTIELDALPVLLNALLAEGQEAPESIQVIVSNDNVSDNMETWLKTQFTSHLVDVDVEFSIEHSDYTHFLYLCEQALQTLDGSAINLLQGDFKPISERRPSTIKWKPVAVLGSVFVAMFVAFNYLQASKIDDQVAKVDQQTKSLYKRYFPQDRNVTDIKRRMSKKLEAASNGGSGEGFLTLLTMVGEKLNELNRGSADARLNPTRITFDQSQGDLKIDFIAGGFADLDALKAKLESISLSVEIARASQDGDKMKARMNIRSAG